MATNYTIDINAKDNTKGAIGGIGGGLTTLNNKASKLKVALGAAAIAGAGIMAGKAILGAIDNMDALAKSARAAGSAGSNEAFQGFQVMKQAMNEAGIDAATFDRAMLQTNSRLKAGTEGQKSFAAVTDKLGDSILDMNGELKSGPELLQSMMNALNEGTITTEEFAKVVGGRAGPLIQEQFASMNTSAGDLQATLDDVAANTNIVNVSAAEDAELFNDTVGRLKEGMGQLMTDAITPLLPVLVQLAETVMAKMPAIIDGVTTAFDTLKPALSLIGTIITDVVWPIMSKLFEVIGFIAGAITPLVETSIPLLKEGFDKASDVIETIVDWFTKLVDKIKAIPEEIKKMKDMIVGNITAMGDKIKDGVGGTVDGVVDGFSWLKNKLVGNSIVPEMVEAIIGEFVRMKEDTVDTTQDMSNQITDTMDSGMGQFESIFEKAFDNGKLEMSDFRDFFKQSLMTMVKDAVWGSNKISSSMSLGQSLHGGGGGKKSGWKSILGGIASAFIPGLGGLFRAGGGPVTRGKSYLVGEQGPEMFTPSGNGSIARNNGGGGAGALTVNFNLSSIDSRSGTEFIIEKKKEIVGMINQAYRKRGKQGIY